MVIGPNPVHYPNQPQLLSMHRRVFDLLAGRVQAAQTTPLDSAVQTQVSDAFELARQQDAQDTTSAPADALARLAKGFYQRLIQLGLLPSRDNADVDQSMVGHSTAVVSAMETLGSNALQFADTVHEVKRGNITVSATSTMPIPQAFILAGRSRSATNTLSGEGISSFHLTGQVQGDNLALRDGFYEPAADLTQPASAQRANWRPSTNGSFYFDESGNRYDIPSNEPVVIPNRRTLLSLGKNLAWYDNGRVQVATIQSLDELYTQRLTQALAELRQGRREAIVLGREGNVIVHEATTSRRHARITWDGQNYMIQDLESLRGTQIDVHAQIQPVHVPSDRPVPIPMVPGSSLLLGNATLGFNPPEMPSRPASA